MANYKSVTRTNYFSVTDSNKLKEIVSHIQWCDGALEFFNEEKGRWGFWGYGSIRGLNFMDTECNNDGDCEEIDTEDDEWEPDVVYEALQKVIAPGDAIIITEIGYENLCYLNAYSIIITCNSIEVEELRTHAILKACEMLNNPKYDTQMEF